MFKSIVRGGDDDEAGDHVRIGDVSSVFQCRIVSNADDLGSPLVLSLSLLSDPRLIVSPKENRLSFFFGVCRVFSCPLLPEAADGDVATGVGIVTLVAVVDAMDVLPVIIVDASVDVDGLDGTNE